MKLKWIPRYSTTNEPDKHGRWARICSCNGLTIAWVSMVAEHRIYNAIDYFPSNNRSEPREISTHSTFEEAKEAVEKRWGKFLSTINAVD